MRAQGKRKASRQAVFEKNLDRSPRAPMCRSGGLRIASLRALRAGRIAGTALEAAPDPIEKAQSRIERSIACD
jgi:hypothetical protein